MVAAWQPPKAENRRRSPRRPFGSEEVDHLPATGLRHRTRGGLPDYTVEILGEVPVADSDAPRPRAIQGPLRPGRHAQARVQWDFGDGQTSDRAEPVHVYLHPGLYTVKLSVYSRTRPWKRSTGSQISRGRRPAGPEKATGPAGRVPADPRPLRPGEDGLPRPSCSWFGLTTRRARPAKAGGWAGGTRDRAGVHDEESIHGLAKLVGPLLRDRLDDPSAALAAWQAAGRAVHRETWKAECEVEAADICLNDLLQRSEAKVLLDAATARLAGSATRSWPGGCTGCGGTGTPGAGTSRPPAPPTPGHDGAVARGDPRRSRRPGAGAFSRSTEAFLRDKELDRALEELRRWQDQFPADKVEGYLPLLQARYWRPGASTNAHRSSQATCSRSTPILPTPISSPSWRRSARRSWAGPTGPWQPTSPS